MTRVLIIEPDARLREIKETELRAAGYLVLGVADEGLARDALRVSSHPMLILEPDDALPLPVDAVDAYDPNAYLDMRPSPFIAAC